jgi:hypothetical protein
MTLAQITFAIAAALAALGLWALASPASWSAAMKAYPRWAPAGWFFVVVDLVWFAMNIKATPLGGLDSFKTYLWIVVPVLIFLLIRFLDELLAARALGGFLLLVPGAILDASRASYDMRYRLVMVVVAYAIAIVGCYLVSGPHRFRLWLASPIANDSKARRTGGALVGLAMCLAGLAQMHYVVHAP